jgi:hypothetical protein
MDTFLKKMIMLEYLEAPYCAKGGFAISFLSPPDGFYRWLGGSSTRDPRGWRR